MSKNAKEEKIGNTRPHKWPPTEDEYCELLLEVTRLKQVVENIPGNVYWRDENGIYLGSNKVFRELFGNIAGHTIYDFLPEQVAKEVEETNEEIIQSGKQCILEEHGYIKGIGNRTYLTIKKPMYDWNNRIIGLVGVSYDITDSKELETLKNEQAITRQQVSSIKTIASSMSHDIRNILAGISLGLGRLGNFFNCWLKRDIPEKDKNELKENQGVVTKLLRRIKDAVNFIEIQLKNITTEKIDTGRFKVLRMSECIEKALDDFAWGNEDMRQRVNVKIDKDYIFLGDLTLTVHLLFNLLSNSTYYIKEEGKGEISIVLTEEGYQPVLYFRDTAKGISEKEAPNIFDRFFSNRTKGTGMGLAFCKSIVLAYAGTMTCTGKENEYIEFKIKLPRLIHDVKIDFDNEKKVTNER